MAMLPQKNNPSLEKVFPNPSEVSPRLYGNELGQPALFSFYTSDIISQTITGGSALLKWLPARGVTTWLENVAHLSWIAPENFDGSDSYADYLATKDPVAECDFGDGFVYQICEYLIDMARVSHSTKNEPIKDEYLGMKLFEQQPQLVLRGDSAGKTLANDRDWSLARLGLGFEDHMAWNAVYGDTAGLPNTFDGLSTILTTNWVKSKARGKGSCDFTDPYIVSGVDVSDAVGAYRRICAVVRKLRRRMWDRNFVPSSDDMAIVINPTMLTYIWFAIAGGAFATFYNPMGINLQATPETVQREMMRLQSGGVGYGVIPVDGVDVSVIPETRMGANTTMDGLPAITGDVLVLTKNFRGLTILEQQYLDWTKLGRNPVPDFTGLHAGEYQPAFFQNGMIKVSVQTLQNNNRCWYYGGEMMGRFVTYMSALQGRITDITIPVELEDEFESGSFTSPNFYAFNGSDGGAGTALLTALT